MIGFAVPSRWKNLLFFAGGSAVNQRRHIGPAADRLERKWCSHDTARCTAGCKTRCTTGRLPVYTLQPVIKQQ